MEFRKGNPQSRKDRRICPKCSRFCGIEERCAACGSQTRPRIQINWYVGGERLRELTSCWRDDDAAKVLQRKEADYWRQQQLGVQRDVGGTLQAARDAFLKLIGGTSANYIKQAKSAIAAVAEGLGWDIEVTSITRDTMTQFRDDGLATLADSTVRSYMLVLRRFFSWLQEEGWIRHDPTRKVRLPKAEGRKDFLREEEVGPVLWVFEKKYPLLAPIATALVLGGWRKGEIVNLRHQDLKLRERWAYVLDFEGDELTDAWTAKTGSSLRAVPLHRLVVKALERIEVIERGDGKRSPWVFPVLDTRKKQRFRDAKGRLQLARGDRRSPGTTFFGKKLRAALREAGVTRNVTIHGLRRTFSVLLQEAGAPDSIIDEALGHGARTVLHRNYLPRRNPIVQKWVDRIVVRVTKPKVLPP